MPEDLPDKSFPRDSYGRRFTNLWYSATLQDGSKVHRDWLSYSPSTNRVYCLHCMMYGINLHKSTRSTWVKDGFNLWINGSASIYKHSMSDNHITASIKFKISTRCIPIIPSLQCERKMQIRLNREVVAELINIVIFLARHNLAFRGPRESWSMATSTSKGNFKDLVILIAKYSAAMSEHITKIQLRGKSELSFVSWERQNQLIDSIADEISFNLQKSIQACKMFSISIDSTFDTSRKEQVSFIVRYVCETSGNVFERLLAMKESANTTGMDLFVLFQNVMDKLNLNWKDDLIGQSYDGAANMRGEYQGLKTLIQNTNLQAIYIWCHAHRLNLVVKNVVSCNIYAIDLFGNIESLYAFIWCSKKRVALLRKYQEKHIHKSHPGQTMVLKRVNTTRWSSHSSALDTILSRHYSIIKTLEDIRTMEGPSDAKTGATCSGLLSYLKSNEFVFTAFLFKKLFDILEPLNKTLQTKDLDLFTATTLIDSVKNKINLLNNRETNNNFNAIILEVKNFSKNSKVEFTPLPTIRKRKVPKRSGELCNDEPITDPKQKFKTDCFFVAIDQVQNELNERFSTNKTGLLNDISLISKRRILEVRSNPNSLPKDAFNVVCNIYFKYLNHEKLVNDYIRFAANIIEIEQSNTLPEYLHPVDENDEGEITDQDNNSDFDLELNDDYDHNNTSSVSSAAEIFKMFYVSKLSGVFPNLYILLKIAITLPVTSVTTERSFSKLKLVKTKLRTTMSEDLLESLMTITCEPDVNIDTDNIIDNFSRKSKSLTKALQN